MVALKKAPPVFRADVGSDGRISMDAGEAGKRRAHLQSLAGKRIGVVYREHSDLRSEQANNYLWGHVYEEACKQLTGNDLTPEMLHDIFCDRFLPNERKRAEFFSRMTGESYSFDYSDTRRSSKLPSGAFYDFVERIRGELFTMGVHTDDPDPSYWRKRAKVH